ncbi:MAG TPA: hypothetical protein PK312_16795, partial [Nitrospira sp.]|nr:hypothetical protein [Nitrospira sp.]
MAIKTSTGLRNAMLATGSAKAALDGGRINIYAGAAPATADAAVGGATLLCAITLNSTGTGILFDTAAVNGVLAKKPSETWSGSIVATGTATWYRHVAAADDGTLSTTAPRIQGTIALIGADLN